MPPIAAPQPRRPRASSPLLQSPTHPRYHISQDDPFICCTPKLKPSQSAFTLESPRLLSPIRLQDRTKRNVMNKSPTPCSSIRGSSGIPLAISRSPRRRRHPSSLKCPFTPRIPSDFDNLPWIDLLSSPSFAHDAWDVSDLSQLIPEDIRPVTSHREGPGPIRRRKLSPRTAPHARSLHARSPQRPAELPALLSAHRGSSIAPHTPPPRFHPSKAHFFNLMPIMTDSPLSEAHFSLH